ncbi:hypothetical protein VOLCADRAFT_92643 [Volvox carteri f. nagariensis]|uniref:Uncharacterized protein n=1 Tax=Volvox carteri f. nagariensis TaxID=3068 RepID=D8U067_VOLCA|nr:uncharacterized protein VOLCADRAFT_92643 [Volvox carteri f. nagariensis]EFJ46887.1 hypothetical protein VOLCADRAFT_92643 [Volvox carteri f. nagariensis]|eukprot:XP_002952096.1 hypothetical protein VOLCADRAFT_92643 [Volvox carteri f. nagariensis]
MKMNTILLLCEYFDQPIISRSAPPPPLLQLPAASTINRNAFSSSPSDPTNGPPTFVGVTWSPLLEAAGRLTIGPTAAGTPAGGPCAGHHRGGGSTGASRLATRCGIPCEHAGSRVVEPLRWPSRCQPWRSSPQRRPSRRWCHSQQLWHLTLLILTKTS